MRLFKKKKAPKVEPIAPVAPEVKPVMSAACGFKYKDRIYNTAKEVNQAYQKERINGLFSVELGIENNGYPYSSGRPYSLAVSLINNHWAEICALASEKLEME